MARSRGKLRKDDKGAIAKTPTDGNGRDKTGGTLGEIFRAAIKRDGRSLAKLTSDCKLPTGKLSRFMNEKATLTLKTADALAVGLGLRLIDNAPNGDWADATSVGMGYFPDRSAVKLEEKLANAKEEIQILTTTMTRSLEYLHAIMGAVERSKGTLKVTILASHPKSKFLGVRASQRRVSEKTYRDSLRSALNYIASQFQPWPNCELLVSPDTLLQLWYRIDGMIYVNFPSIGRPTSNNSVVSLDIERPGVRETFLQYFANLREQPTTKKYIAGP